MYWKLLLPFTVSSISFHSGPHFCLSLSADDCDGTIEDCDGAIEMEKTQSRVSQASQLGADWLPHSSQLSFLSATGARRFTIVQFELHNCFTALFCFTIVHQLSCTVFRAIV